MIIQTSPEIEAFWKSACKALDLDEESPHYALPFVEHDENTDADEIAIIDQISEMAKKSLKRGTCHLVMQFENENVPMRSLGDHWIVLRTDGTPNCVVRIIAINIVPFNQVGPEFAASEGPEAGLIPSWENWNRAHREYFQEHCRRWGVPWREDYPVVCESFITVYSPHYDLDIS